MQLFGLVGLVFIEHCFSLQYNLVPIPKRSGLCKSLRSLHLFRFFLRGTSRL